MNKENKKEYKTTEQQRLTMLKYYEKIRQNKTECDVCNCTVQTKSMSHHLKTKRHELNLLRIELQKQVK